jgi:hypothetical protein
MLIHLIYMSAYAKHACMLTCLIDVLLCASRRKCTHPYLYDLLKGKEVRHGGSVWQASL